MSRSLEYDRDIAEMYGTAEASLVFFVSADYRQAYPTGFGYAYYPTGEQADPTLVVINEFVIVL